MTAALIANDGVLYLATAFAALAVLFFALWRSERPVDPWAPSRVETQARAVEDALSGKRGPR